MTELVKSRGRIVSSWADVNALLDGASEEVGTEIGASTPHYIIPHPAVSVAATRYPWDDIKNPSSYHKTKTAGEENEGFDFEADLPRLRSALDVIPSDDRDTWMTIGRGIHNASGGSPLGYEVWTEWSQSSRKFEEAEQRRQWQYLRDKPHGTTIASVYDLARQHGWTDERSARPLPAMPKLSIERIELNENRRGYVSATMDKVFRLFESRDHRPSDHQKYGLRQIANGIIGMAAGAVEPKFYLSFLDPGVGKTTVIIQAIRQLLTIPEFKETGVIIFLSRVSEISKLAEEMGLTTVDYAVIVSDNYKEKDHGNPDRQAARVLFTTQQMLESRARDGKSFADIRDFHYRGCPRQVKIWDEAILPSRTLTLEQDDLASLFGGCADSGAVSLRDTLVQFFTQLEQEADRSIVTVPEIEGLIEGGFEEFRTWFNDEKDKDAAEALFKLSGRTVRVRKEPKRTILDYDELLPADVAPMLILDASGQQKQVYVDWHNFRRDLVGLLSPRKNYSGLTVHICDMGSGKTTQKNKEGWTRVVEETCRMIDDIPQGEPILVIHFKSGKMIRDIPAEIRKQRPQRELYFCHWGLHTATNEFRQIQHVIMAGVQQYSTSQYEAIARGAKKLTTEQHLSEQDFNGTRLGEIASNIFQATCRGAARKSDGDGCPQGCHLHVMASANRNTGVPRELFERIFPGAAVLDWKRSPRITGKTEKLVKFLLSKNTGEGLRIGDIATAIGVRTNNVYRLLDDGQECLKGYGIEISRDRGAIILRHSQPSAAQRGTTKRPLPF